MRFPFFCEPSSKIDYYLSANKCDPDNHLTLLIMYPISCLIAIFFLFLLKRAEQRDNHELLALAEERMRLIP